MFFPTPLKISRAQELHNPVRATPPLTLIWAPAKHFGAYLKFRLSQEKGCGCVCVCGKRMSHQAVLGAGFLGQPGIAPRIPHNWQETTTVLIWNGSVGGCEMFVRNSKLKQCCHFRRAECFSVLACLSLLWDSNPRPPAY